jgi:hypothetical protein
LSPRTPFASSSWALKKSEKTGSWIGRTGRTMTLVRWTAAGRRSHHPWLQHGTRCATFRKGQTSPPLPFAMTYPNNFYNQLQLPHPTVSMFMSFIEDIIIRVDRELSAVIVMHGMAWHGRQRSSSAAARPAISEGRRTDGLIRESARAQQARRPERWMDWRGRDAKYIATFTTYVFSLDSS